MGGWGSGRQGGRVTIEGCGSFRLAISDLGDLLRSPVGRAVGAMPRPAFTYRPNGA